LFRVRPSQILAWPAWELDLIEHYLAKQPAPEERVEIAIARLTLSYLSAHRGRGEPEIQLKELLPYLSPEWVEVPRFDSARYDDVDRSILEAFGAKQR
jgi:hypothetical protein